MLVIASFSRYVLRCFASPHANSIAISERKTGVARTMTWYGDIPALSGASGQGASGVNPDDPLDDAGLQPADHADHVVVQVHGRIAVPRDQPQRAPERRDARAAARGLEDAVLVAAVEVFELALGADGEHLGQARVDRVALVSGVAHGMVDARADHLRLDEQRVLELRLRGIALVRGVVR